MINLFSDPSRLRLGDLTRCSVLLEADTPNKTSSGPAEYLRAIGFKRKNN